MKALKNYTLFALVFGCSHAAIAESYTTDFEAPVFGDPLAEVAGTDGWLIDDPTADISFVVSAWDPDGPGPKPSSQAAGLGGFFDSPGGAGTEVNLTRDVSLDLNGAEFDVDFAVMSSTGGFPGEDTFGFTFRSSTSELLRIAFEPSDGLGDLELVWYEQSTRHSVLSDISYDSSNSLNVVFSADGANMGFSATVTSTNSVGFSGVLSGQAGATLSSVGADFDVVGNGDNFLAFDNFSVVPEPQSALLLAAGLLLGMRRTRK